MGMIDGFIADDNLGLGSTATSLRPIGLALRRLLALCHCRFSQQNSCGDYALTAGAGES